MNDVDTASGHNSCLVYNYHKTKDHLLIDRAVPTERLHKSKNRLGSRMDQFVGERVGTERITGL